VADNQKGIPFSSDDEGKPFPDVARGLVEQITDGNVYVVWFAYVLGYWKALCSTDVADGRYYEVTFHKEKGVAFVDTYVKERNDEVQVPPAGRATSA
jgi:hypothetical protein